MPGIFLYTEETSFFIILLGVHGKVWTFAKKRLYKYIFTQQYTFIEAFKALQNRVAASAFHNSAQRIDPPRCHPDTRVEILRFMYAWIASSPSARKEWILWLNGAAGAGKSAIMQSLAEQCVGTAIAIASFFFFRSDPSRNTIMPFVPAVVYQLIQTIPETLDNVLDVIEQNPLIFEEALESQIHKLIITPLLKLPADLQRLFLICIDGLDECTSHAHQELLIEVIGKISSGRNLPLIFLVASRREPQIEAAFVQSPVSDLLYTYALDNSDIERTSSDIRHYLNAKFNTIKSNHLRKHLLPEDWPPASTIEEIIEKSSGQFIYASVVIKYVSSPRANPARQLAIVSDITLRTASTQNPFSHLDALYRYIFSQVERIEEVLNILAYFLLTRTTHIRDIQNVFFLPYGEVEVLFADLTAVILCEPDTPETLAPQLKFLHASLRDFLLDKTRSEEYYIDLTAYRTKLLCGFLRSSSASMLDAVSELAMQSQGSSSMIYSFYGSEHSNRPRPEIWRMVAIKLLLEDAHASEELRQAVMKFDFTITRHSGKKLILSGCVADILRSLKVLSHRFDDCGQAYSHAVNIFARRFAEHWASLNTDAKNQLTGDLRERIIHICQGSGDE
ncbi:hypothetical protein BDN70DRAFT_877677 [Pholiota conissans]|uniref:Nephrocystin 3-like N-terminal domain-containing protein n=1 Tax=Pholiota conissans TaxID=109636 RepID=A0A9P5Z537_9AGAR|nr:hypothetical protein BDN70DRAFT_877677 [Pholiota conissans]